MLYIMNMLLSIFCIKRSAYTIDAGKHWVEEKHVASLSRVGLILLMS